jgi:hypothetical protein
MVIITAALAAIVGGAGVSVARVSQQEAPGGDHTAPSQSSAPCESPPAVREPRLCDDVTVEGVRVRYGVLPASDRPTDRTILLDLGGPGSSPLASTGLAAASLLGPELTATHNVLMIEEPWVLAEVNGRCQRRLTSFYRSVRRAERWTEAEAERVVDACSLGHDGARRWGFGPGTYPGLVAEIESKAEFDVTGFVGASFGSVRWAYGGPSGLEWTVLLRPFPIGATGEALLSARARLIDEQYPAGALARVARDGTDEGVRSVPVGDVDVASARVFSGQTGVAPSSAEEVGRYSDRLWQRYGEDSISPALLAYWDEVCAAAGDWPDPGWTGRGDDTRGFLARFHAPCRAIPSAATPAVPTGPSGDLCVVLGMRDAVAPGALGQEQLGRHADVVVRSSAVAHDSFDQLDACLDAVARPSPRRR